MAHVIAVVMVLGLSGLPAGSLLCGLACAPDEAVAPSCHEHGGSDDGAPAMEGVHLCDQDAAAVPMLAPPVFSIATADVIAPQIQPQLSLPARATILRAWELPPGSSPALLAASPSILRV